MAIYLIIWPVGRAPPGTLKCFQNRENPYKTCRFLTFLVILMLPTKTISERRRRSQSIEIWRKVPDKWHFGRRQYFLRARPGLIFYVQCYFLRVHVKKSVSYLRFLSFRHGSGPNPAARYFEWSFRSGSQWNTRILLRI